MGAQRVRASVRAMMGVIKNKNGEEVRGRMGSLMKSLMPSAMGWRSP